MYQGGTCLQNAPVSNAQKLLVEKPEGKLQFWRARRVCENDIKMGLKQMNCWEVVGWILVAQDRD
jgi:hypothetical protein